MPSCCVSPGKAGWALGQEMGHFYLLLVPSKPGHCGPVLGVKGSLEAGDAAWEPRSS